MYERGCYLCDIFSHWLKPSSVKDEKQDQDSSKAIILEPVNQLISP